MTKNTTIKQYIALVVIALGVFFLMPSTTNAQEDRSAGGPSVGSSSESSSDSGSSSQSSSSSNEDRSANTPRTGSSSESSSDRGASTPSTGSSNEGSSDRGGVPSTGSSNEGSSDRGGNTPSTGSSSEGSSDRGTNTNGGNGGNNGGSNGSDTNNNGGRRSRGGRSGSSTQVIPVISNLTVTPVSANTIKVSWNTSIPTYGQLVYGNFSREVVENVINFGYTNGTAITSDMKTTHEFIISITPGVTTFIRPVYGNGRTVFFGPEYALTKNVTATSPVYRPTQSKPAPTTGSTIKPAESTSGGVQIDVTGTTTETTSGSGNEANVIGSTDMSLWQKIKNCVKELWGFLIGK